MSTVPPSQVRSAKVVIDSAIRENRFGEWLCYGLILLFAIVGVGVLIVGAIRSEGLISLAGSITSGLFWPAFNQAHRIRKENLMIRLLELTLSKETTAEEAARALQETFLSIFETRQRTPPRKK